MKSSAKKVIAICTACAVLVIGLLSVGLWGYFKDDNRKLSDMQKIEKVLAKTSEKMQTNNKNLVDSYNKTIEDKLQQEIEGGVQTFASSYADRDYTYISGKDVFPFALQTVNSYTEWYVYFEYLYEFLDSSFLNKTYDVQAKVGSSTYDIYAKYTCGYDNIKLMVTTPDKVYGDVDDMVATLYFNERTLEPTTLVFKDKYTNTNGTNSSKPYTFSRFIYFDFKEGTFDFVEVSMPSSSKVTELKHVEGANILDKLYNAEFYHVEFNDYSKFYGTYAYAYSSLSGDLIAEKSLSETKFKEEVFQKLSQADQAKFVDTITEAEFSNLDNFEDNFDLENAIPFEKGDEAMRYGQNKYRIEENTTGDDVVYLTVRQTYGIDDIVMSALQVVEDVYNGEYHEFDICNNLNFEDNEVNYKKDIQIDKTLLTQEDFAAIKNWFENDYDETKYYFEEIKINNVLTAVISNQEFVVYKNYGTENATSMRVYYYSSNWSFTIGQFSSAGFKQFELNFYNYDDHKQMSVHNYSSSKKLNDFTSVSDYEEVEADLHEYWNYYISDFYSFYYSKRTAEQTETFSVADSEDTSSPNHNLSPNHNISSGTKDTFYLNLFEYTNLGI